MAVSNVRKQLLLDAIQYASEFDDLLGKGRGVVRSCFNKSAHSSGDKTPSLSFAVKTGAWRCHGCHECGDIFTLYSKVKGMNYPETLEHLLKKYGLWEKAGRLTKAEYETKYTAKDTESKFKILTDLKEKKLYQLSLTHWAMYDERVKFMFDRYGLTIDTIRQYGLGYDANPGTGRVLLPVWQSETGTYGTTRARAMVNIRKHDCFRFHCQWLPPGATSKDEAVKKRPEHITVDAIAKQDLAGWTPSWSKEPGKGKVLSVMGHGAPYLYPMSVMFEAPFIYVVGGELKALLLNQIGVPAVAWTAGEGQHSDELLPLFLGKRIRVLLDLDKAGVEGTFGREPGTRDEKDPGFTGLAVKLANAGALVQAGRWPAAVCEVLPPKGDVTDFLMATRDEQGRFQPDALDLLEWVDIERQEVADQSDILPLEIRPREVIDWNALPIAKFDDLVEPTKLNTWMRFGAMVSGRGEAPYAVPRLVVADCQQGRDRPRKICSDCKLTRSAFKGEIEFSTEAQVDLVGQAKVEVEFAVNRALGIPKTCQLAELTTTNSAVEQVVLTPTVDIGTGVNVSFAHRSAFILAEEMVRIRENVPYTFAGQVLKDPKNSRFVVAVRESRPSDGDILHWVKDDKKEAQLAGMMKGSAAGTIKFVLSQLREHVTQIYGQDDMLLAIALGFFMPFQFAVGTKVNERICPAVLILGDSTVGKSTATKRMIRHFKAGRFNSCAEHPTFAGLVGGEVKMAGGRSAFSWGVLPTSHRTILALDEANKLPTDHIASLTNVLSSGVAQRALNSGNRSIACEVRMLYLANPRGERELKSFADPVEAAFKIMGTVQDLGRVDYLHIQHQLEDKSIFEKLPEPTTEYLYDSEVARYHMSWAWGLTSDRIRFVNPQHVLERAGVLSSKFGNHPLLYAAQAWGKLGRIAAGLAALVRSTDGHNLVVDREHVDLAAGLLDRNYSRLLGNRGAGGLPTELLKVLDAVPVHRLRPLVSLDRFSREDLQDFVGRMESVDLLAVAHAQLGYFTKVGLFFRWADPAHSDALASYLGSRRRRELKEQKARHNMPEE